MAETQVRRFLYWLEPSAGEDPGRILSACHQRVPGDPDGTAWPKQLCPHRHRFSQQVQRPPAQALYRGAAAMLHSVRRVGHYRISGRSPEELARTPRVRVDHVEQLRGARLISILGRGHGDLQSTANDLSVPPNRSVVVAVVLHALAPQPRLDERRVGIEFLAINV